MRKLTTLILVALLAVIPVFGAFNNTWSDVNVGSRLDFPGSFATFNWMHGDGNNNNFEWTIRFRCYPYTVKSYNTVFSTQQGTSTRGVVVFGDGDGGFYLAVYGSGALIALTTATGLTPINTWTDIAITYSQSLGSDNLKVYVNGFLSESQTKAAETGADGNSQYDGEFGQYLEFYSFNGMIDDFRIYQRALSANEILEIYNGQGEDNIIQDLYLRLLTSGSNGQSMPAGSVVYDISGNNLHGTVGIAGSPATPTFIPSPVFVK